mmetsp:Transcript_2759/g.2401  ORF Transcript_2759/g.2401 Transcript_2759/m.2401 type:complete len:89 (+) Transcript_2759:297-563(+)|eukprot:CAMPEP_0114579846 /NCGR_PEP_ID=MMETSP0125-20121206/4195_1 /TAXON_ID=485358 ORGANISM="Aristerostoma sp., Strain ATCC 50986" /NCGR_SAMPLE_ID=MMETSP0125 /ASSEMBLY_ACC=CAM_ASM_000245 /LENGTH=88 /DNA_ID=CAMNT_0001770943 /DNA_START=371 /DNA_END=637 /DNA_ORIENTATION=+
MTVSTDLKSKVRLMRDNNKSKYEYMELQDNYETLVKKKAIYVPEDTKIGNQGARPSVSGRPVTAGSSRFNKEFSSTTKSFGQFGLDKA